MAGGTEDNMNYTGIVLATITILIIGIFHPIVIWAEYHFSKKIWPVFMVAGLIFLIFSLIAKQDIISCILAVFAATFFWSIVELFHQEKRVEKGWYPKKHKR